MMRLCELRTTPMDVVLRALAILMVTYHHSHLPPRGQAGFAMGLGGGMTFLLLLSGMNFARFAMAGADGAAVRQSILVFARQVYVPLNTVGVTGVRGGTEIQLARAAFRSELHDRAAIRFLRPVVPERSSSTARDLLSAFLNSASGQADASLPRARHVGALRRSTGAQRRRAAALGHHVPCGPRPSSVFVEFRAWLSAVLPGRKGRGTEIMVDAGGYRLHCRGRDDWLPPDAT